MISSSSVETISTPSPSSRASTIRSWMYSIEPTSTPRVGCAAISSLVSRDSSRADDQLLLVAAREVVGEA